MLKKTVATMAIIAGLTATGAEALSLKKGAQPAEYPPAGYKPDTYVDSRGCVYIRAGFAGSVTWVPRVSRSRKVVCGAQPTIGPKPAEVVVETTPETPAAPTTAPKVVAKPTPVRPVPTELGVTPALTAKPTTKTVKVAPKPTKTSPLPKAVRMSSAPRPTRGTGASSPIALPPRVGFGTPVPGLPPRAQPAPLWSDRYASHPVPQQNANPSLIPSVAAVVNLAEFTVPEVIVDDDMAVTRTVRVNCPARSRVSQVYLGEAKLPVRCGPQQNAPVSYVVAHRDGQRTRVVTMPHPSNVADYAPDQSAGYAPSPHVPVPSTHVSVPQGNGHPPREYTFVRRRDLDKAALPPSTVIAPQTYVASNMPVDVPDGYRAAWGDDRLNPMRGVRTIDGDMQTAQIWTQNVPRQLIGATLPKQGLAGANIFGSTAGSGNEVIAARGTPALPSRAQSLSAQSASHRYVRVGIVSDPAMAKKVIRKLQRLGLRVSSTTSSRNGKQVKTILAGPFERQASLSAALEKVQRAGFTGATLRN